MSDPVTEFIDAAGELVFWGLIGLGMVAWRAVKKFRSAHSRTPQPPPVVEVASRAHRPPSRGQFAAWQAPQRPVLPPSPVTAPPPGMQPARRDPMDAIDWRSRQTPLD